jgi:Fanconi anemia group M protein
MPSKEITIICDHRENASSVLSELSSLSTIDIKVNLIMEQLSVGDYQLAEDIVIERKTLSDLETSIIDGRIFSQIQEMSLIKRSALLVEGEASKLYSSHRINSKATIGLLTSIGLNYRVPIFFTKNQKETALFLYLMAKKEQIINGNGNDSKLRYSKTKMSGSDWQLFIMQSFPDVGPTLAKSILKEFKSIKNIANAEIKDLTTIEKLGPKKAQKIKYLFEREY